MTIHYQPNIGFEVNSNNIKWGTTRESVRQAFALEFQEDDGVLDNSAFFDGDTSYNIVYKQDHYENFKASYNSENCLKELEIFNEITIIVSEVTLTFGKDVSELVREFEKQHHTATKIDDGNFFIEDLKITIASSASMGGEGNGLAYFYCGKDVQHVIDEINELKNGI